MTPNRSLLSNLIICGFLKLSSLVPCPQPELMHPAVDELPAVPEETFFMSSAEQLCNGVPLPLLPFIVVSNASVHTVIIGWFRT